MPPDWNLKDIDPEGNRPFGKVKALVVKRAHQYYDLIVKRKTEREYKLLDALDLYESFHYIQRQTTWGDFPWGCVCVRCNKWTLRVHISVDVSVQVRCCGTR